MQIRNTRQRWGAAAQLLHWSIAAAVLVMLGLGWWAESLGYSKLKVDLFWVHKSLGMLVLAAMTLRLLWRLTNPAPALPSGLKAWERGAAHVTHYGLYVLLLAMPLSGWVINSAANFPLSVFGWFEVPAIVGPDDDLKSLASDVHGVLAWIIVGVLVLHVAAALKHHFVLRDDVLRRMLPGVRLRGSDGEI
ncbi:MAG: cytochrome B [Nevskiales bacterium]|nr:cytochrome B [Nevskiales bacterium]